MNMANNVIDLFAVNPHAAFYSTINFYPVQFMIDTGAVVSLIDTDTWNKVEGMSTLQPGMPLRVMGTATLQGVTSTKLK